LVFQKAFLKGSYEPYYCIHLLFDINIQAACSAVSTSFI